MNDKIKVYSDLMTWLNGRAEKIIVFHDNKKVLVWDNLMGISIEDAIIIFCKKNKIDILKEITI